MFVSIQIVEYFSSDHKSLYYWQFSYTLVDDEFGEVSGEVSDASVGMFAGAVAIIIEYSKRKLNVEGNLVKYLTQYCSKYNWKLTELLAWFDQACLDPRLAELAKLWKTVDQAKLLKYAVFT